MGEDKQTQTEFDSEQVLYDLKSLYDHFHKPFSEDDEYRVIQAVYRPDNPVIRLYREVLF